MRAARPRGAEGGGGFSSLSFAARENCKARRRQTLVWPLLCIAPIPYCRTARVVAPLCVRRAPVGSGGARCSSRVSGCIPSSCSTPYACPVPSSCAPRRELRPKGVVAGHGPGASSLRKPPLPRTGLWLSTDIVFYINALFAAFREGSPAHCTVHRATLLWIGT